jgi:putative phage-type endonuclease
MPDERLSRDEWLERRRGYIGGSDAAAALGISRYKSRLKLWQDKRGELEDKPTKYMERGTVLEPLVAGLYRTQTKHVAKPGAWVVSDDPDCAFMAATPDLLDIDLDCIVQIKTSSTWARHDFGDSGTQKIPDEYMIQTQHEMAVTGAQVNMLAVLFADESTFDGLVYMMKAGLPIVRVRPFVEDLLADPKSKCEFCLYPIERDEELIATIIDAERRFWEDYVLAGVMPPDDSIPEKTTDIIVADVQATKMLEGLRDAEIARKKAEDTEEHWVVQIKNLIGENAGITANGLGRVTFKAPSPKNVTGWKELALSMRDSDPEAYDILEKKYTKKKQDARRFVKTWVQE